jgi:uncharacterized Zn finger protein (UPF0148 family)
MAKTIFSHALRALLCPSCGAPIEVAITGGQTSCAYCHTTLHLARRDESADIQKAQAAAQLSESERFALLRSQDASPRPLPPDLEPLRSGPGLAPEHVGQATTLWQTTRQRVERGAPFPDQERLFFLTVLLVPHVDERTRRALLENAVELLADDRHRHVFRCSLAEQAVLVGDVEAARRWLRPCSPRASDLTMDTAYRIAMACIAAAERRPDDVFAQLGSKPGDIPLADEYESKALLLWGDALERTSGAAVATHKLTAIVLRDPRRLHPFKTAAHHFASLGLCPESGPAATAAAWSHVDAQIRPRSVTSLGCILLGSLVPIGGMALALAGGLGLLTEDSDARVNLVLHPMIWLVLLPITFLVSMYYGRKSTMGLRDRGVLSFARVGASIRRVVRSKNSSRVYQQMAVQVLIDGRYVPITFSVRREDPVPPGVYPCFADPMSPEATVIQLDPLA